MNDNEESRIHTFKRHKELIVANCLSLLPQLKAIILYGSYGRNEGGWFISNGSWKPYNDYDICLIINYKVNSEIIKVLENTLSKEIGIKWIDINQYTEKEIINFKPTILNFDFKYGSDVIYGDSGVLSTIPSFQAKDLTLKEAQILFNTRLYTLLGSFEENAFITGLSGESSRFFRNQMSKAILALVDVLLLQKGIYYSSYVTRVNEFIKKYPQKKIIISLSKWAIDEKLRPKDKMMPGSEVERFYSKIHELYFKEMYQVLSIYLGRRIENPQDIEMYMKWAPINILKRLFWFIQYRGFKMEKMIFLTLAQCYIADAWTNKGINESNLKLGLYFLQKVEANISLNLNWDEARIICAKLRKGD